MRAPHLIILTADVQIAPLGILKHINYILTRTTTAAADSLTAHNIRRQLRAAIIQISVLQKVFNCYLIDFPTIEDLFQGDVL